MDRIVHTSRCVLTPDICFDSERHPGISLVNSSTQYIYDARTRTYIQPDLSSELLRRFNQINSRSLEAIVLRKDTLFGKTTFRAGTPLPDLIHFAVETDQTSAPAVLQTVLSEVAHQEK